MLCGWSRSVVVHPFSGVLLPRGCARRCSCLLFWLGIRVFHRQVSQKAYLNGLQCFPLIVKNCQEKLLARICREDRQVADSTFSREGIFAEVRFSMVFTEHRHGAPGPLLRSPARFGVCIPRECSLLWLRISFLY